jgi:hypothetical protein
MVATGHDVVHVRCRLRTALARLGIASGAAVAVAPQDTLAEALPPFRELRAALASLPTGHREPPPPDVVSARRYDQRRTHAESREG